MIDSTPQKSAQRGPVHAPSGHTLSCQGWPQEAVLRMLMNSVDAEVAECPDQLIVHAFEKAAPSWEKYAAIVAALRALPANHTLVVRAGETADAFPTSAEAPRVLITNECPTRHGAFSQTVSPAGLIQRGQAGAALWLYTGTQSALHTAYLVFAGAAQKHFAGTLAGKLVVSGGMGGAGGAQPLAAAWSGAAFLGIDADAERIKRREKRGYCDVLVNNLDEAMRILKNAVRKGEPAAVGLAGNCAEIIPAMAERGIVPDLLTDQTSAQDLLAYIPRGLDPSAVDELRRRDPDEYRRRALDSIAAHVRGMLELQRLGSVLFDCANGLREQAAVAGVPGADAIPSADAEFLQHLLRRGLAPMLWVALSGEAADIRRLDAVLLEEFAANESLSRWIRLVRQRARFEGLPARVCWLERSARVRFAAQINSLVSRGELQAPVVLAWDCDDAQLRWHSNESNIASAATLPDWPVLQAAAGAALVAVETGESGSPRAASLLVVADGTPQAASNLSRLLA